MGRSVLWLLIWGNSVCLCPIKRTQGLYGLSMKAQKEYVPAHKYVPHSSDPINDTLLRGASKKRTNSGRNIPNEYPMPSTIILHNKDDATMTHPQPPSGGVGIRLLMLPSDSADCTDTVLCPFTFPFCFGLFDISV